MKSYTTENGLVTYGFNRGSRKWEFKTKTKDQTDYSVFLECPNGVESAHKIAATMSKTAAGKTMNNGTRHNIRQILATELKAA